MLREVLNGDSDDNCTGDFSWQTSAGDAGSYTAYFTLSDGELSDDASISVSEPGQGNSLHVAAIDMSSAGKKKKKVRLRLQFLINQISP